MAIHVVFILYTFEKNKIPIESSLFFFPFNLTLKWALMQLNSLSEQNNVWVKKNHNSVPKKTLIVSAKCMSVNWNF